MRKARTSMALALLLVLPRVVAAQTADTAAAKSDGGLRFELGDGRSHTVTWFTREPDEIETTIQRVVTPVKVGGVPRLEVYTNIEVRQKKALIQRSSEKRVYNATDMRPVSSRIDTDFMAGASLQSGWRELTYDAQRVKGMAVDQKGAREQIDKEMPGEALIVPGVAFTFLQNDQVTPGSTITFKTYNENTDGLEDGHVKIVKREKVTVAGESYDAWKVEIKTGRTNATAHYTTTVPRVLLRLRDNQRFQELIEMSR